MRTRRVSARHKVSFASCALTVLAFFATSYGEPVPSFRNEVLPVLTKAGCNSGSCHGALAGKNGFRLSLRGYDPEADYAALTREASGRRVLKAEPAQSLILLKPTLAIGHGGGKRLDVGSPEYLIIANWIASGAPPPSSADPTIQSITVTPSPVLLKPGDKTQLSVKARYSDRTERDVTRWVKFSSADEGVAAVDGDGLVKAQSHGEAPIALWYSSKVSFARVTIPFPARLEDAVFKKVPRNNFIDDKVLAKLQELHIAPSDLATDREFVRRAYLDTLGILPIPEEVDEFLRDSRADKRERLIEQILQRSEFVDHWSYKWSDLLLVSTLKLPRSAMWSYYNWIRKSVVENKPWDQFARELITATGTTLQNGATNFYLIHKEPIEITETVSQAFLGVSIGCAKCHNHPMEKWTQSDYYGMANLFSRVSLKTRTDAADVTVVPSAMGEINHLRLGKPMPPRGLNGEALSLDSPKDRRTHFAEWLTSPQNPYFSKAIVNRVWAHFMGRGLVDPVDDLRDTNPPSNPELLIALTDDFVNHRFDIKHLVRTILNSAAYQLSARSNETNAKDDRYYSHYFVRRLPGEVILDAISQVTGVPEEFEGYPRGYRARQLPDSKVTSYFLSSFGRPVRALTCECERQGYSNVTQALHLINGSTLDQKLRSKGNIVDRLLKGKLSKEDAVTKVYELALSRSPTSQDFASLSPGIDPAERETLEDLLWAVLTSKEFLFNH